MRRALHLLIVTISFSLMSCSTIEGDPVLDEYAWQARSDETRDARPYKDNWTTKRMQSVITKFETVEKVCDAFRTDHSCPAGSIARSRVTSDTPRCEVYCETDGVLENGMYLSYTEAPIPTIEKGPFVDGKRNGAWSKLQRPSAEATRLITTEVRHYRQGALDGRRTMYLSSGTAFDQTNYADGARSVDGDVSNPGLYGGL